MSYTVKTIRVKEGHKAWPVTVGLTIRTTGHCCGMSEASNLRTDNIKKVDRKGFVTSEGYVEIDESTRDRLYSRVGQMILEHLYLSNTGILLFSDAVGLGWSGAGGGGNRNGGISFAGFAKTYGIRTSSKTKSPKTGHVIALYSVTEDALKEKHKEFCKSLKEKKKVK